MALRPASGTGAGRFRLENESGAGRKAAVFLDGLEVRFTMGAFELMVGPIQILIAMAAAVCVAVFGVLPPAIRCLKSPINEALKSI